MPNNDTINEEQFTPVTRFELVKRRFFRNRLAVAAGIILIILYITMVFAPSFFAPNNYMAQDTDHQYAPPQRIRFFDNEGNFHLRPFVYDWNVSFDPASFRSEFLPNYDEKHHIYFFTEGYEHRLLGLFSTNIHFFNIKDQSAPFYPFGSDRLGRCTFSRILIGGQISLTVGLLGVALSIVLGSIIGTMSGYLGGTFDHIVQRFTEILLSFPSILLWAALAAAVPPGFSSIQRFFAISTIISLRNWSRLGRQLRGQVLSLRNEEYAHAAIAAGGSSFYIVRRHMIPNVLSHIIVIGTLSIPDMIIAETSLSFLGLGIQSPMVSWGALLERAQRASVVINHPWLIFPGLFVIIAVLCFNFLGDGIRDAFDPYADI